MSGEDEVEETTWIGWGRCRAGEDVEPGDDSWAPSSASGTLHGHEKVKSKRDAEPGDDTWGPSLLQGPCMHITKWKWKM
jgi:hypothetical protein